MPDKEVRAALEDSFPLWVLRSYAKATGKSDRAVLEFILERWAMVDKDAERYGITLAAFANESTAPKVLQLDKKRHATEGRVS